MKILRTENKFCISCMDTHDVSIIETEEKATFKGVKVNFIATYEYCSNSDEFLETEDMIKANGLAVKDAYRKEAGMLTSKEIINIRDKYDISQKEFSKVLDWGEATIARYETHQVQDRAHDDILRRIELEPKLFLAFLERAKAKISLRMYQTYRNNALQLCFKKDNPYSKSKITTHVIVETRNVKKQRTNSFFDSLYLINQSSREKECSLAR
jgi:putative zinc finger/helix-turn-helix YgiT family protein